MLLITTGGTIDSHRDTRQQMIAPLRHTLVPETMNTLGLSYDEHISLCVKDARDLDRNDLNRLLEIINSTDHKQILITHGYQTMADTMQWIKKELEGIGRRGKEQGILFVDSLIPLSEPDSDGKAQLIAAHQTLTTSNSQLLTAIRAGETITADELKSLQYQGKVASQWCV